MKVYLALASSLLAFCGISATQSAVASDPPLACTVSPGTAGGCSSNVPAPEYQVRLQVPNPQVSSYTWSYYDEDKGTTHPINCATSLCYISTNAINDRFWDIYAEEVVTGRTPTTYEASLDLAAVCGKTFC